MVSCVGLARRLWMKMFTLLLGLGVCFAELGCAHQKQSVAGPASAANSQQAPEILLSPPSSDGKGEPTSDAKQEGNDPNRLVALKNKATLSWSVVQITMVALRNLQASGLPGVLAVYDLVQKCKDPEYRLFGQAETLLKNRGLLEQGGKTIHAVCDVAVSAAVGEKLEFHLENPVQ